MPLLVFFFFFNDTATTEIYTLSLHDALPISVHERATVAVAEDGSVADAHEDVALGVVRSEEHTSELQSPCNLVCRLLLEKKKRTRQASEGRRYRPHSSWTRTSVR